jgi:hypothetical protein
VCTFCKGHKKGQDILLAEDGFWDPELETAKKEKQQNFNLQAYKIPHVCLQGCLGGTFEVLTTHPCRQ